MTTLQEGDTWQSIGLSAIGLVHIPPTTAKPENSGRRSIVMPTTAYIQIMEIHAHMLQMGKRSTIACHEDLDSHQTALATTPWSLLKDTPTMLNKDRYYNNFTWIAGKDANETFPLYRWSLAQVEYEMSLFMYTVKWK